MEPWVSDCNFSGFNIKIWAFGTRALICQRHRRAIVCVYVCSGSLCNQISSKDTLKLFTATLRSTFKCVCVDVSFAIPAGEQKGLGHESHNPSCSGTERGLEKRGSWMDSLPRPLPSPWDTELDTCVCVTGDCMWVFECVCVCVCWGGGGGGVVGTGWEVQLIKKDLTTP